MKLFKYFLFQSTNCHRLSQFKGFSGGEATIRDGAHIRRNTVMMIKR